MLFLCQILTDDDQVLEGYARDEEHMRHKMSEQHPEIKDYEIFGGGYAPEFLTLQMYREMVAMGIPKRTIMQIDQKLIDKLGE